MKILAIRIKNLASLEGTTEIDFTTEPLSSAGIFAITGATGAGKSTILDALCLALYGKTPRYLQAKEVGVEIKDVQGSTLSQGDVRSILRDGTADGFAEVDFVGIDGLHYRANWNVRRARNLADGNLQSDSITLKNITSHIEIPGKKAETLHEIARLIGLNFEQFTRSVLLAQGDFTAFMKASKDEKASLLEKLTGTHIYSEISKKIYDKYKVEEGLLRDLNFRKEGVVTLTENELQSISSEQELLNVQIISLEKDIEKLSLELNWHQQLTKLHASYNEANSALSRATDVKTSALPRQQKLLTVEQAQQTRSWADGLKHAQLQQADKTIKLTVLKATISTLQTQKDTLKTQTELVANQLTARNKALVDALPLLEKAKQLETLLAEKKEQLAKLQKESENANDTNQKHQTLLTAKQDEFDKLVAQLKTVTDWKTENTTRGPIAEHQNLILSKLRDAQKFLEISHASATQLAQLQDKIKTEESQKENLEQHWKQQFESLEKLNKSFEKDTKELLITPIEKLDLAKATIDRQLEHTLQSQTHWRLYDQAFTTTKALELKQQKDQADYHTKQETLDKLKLQLPLAEVEKNTAYQLLQQARLASAENVVTLRNALIENEPCPVCGSNSHPYALHNPQLDNVLAQLEKYSQEKEQSYVSLYSQHNTLRQETITLQQTIQEQQEHLKAQQSALKTQKEVWEQFDSAKESQTIADAEKTTWIENKLESLQVEQSNLTTQIQNFANKKRALEAVKIQLDQLKNQTDGLTNQIKDSQSKLSLYHEQYSGQSKQRDQATTNLDEVAHQLSPYFTISNWMEKWKAAPVAFVDSIDAFAQNWRANIEKLERYSREKAILEATLKELGNQAQSLALEVTKKTETHLAQQQQHLALTQQRNALFEGKSAEETEAQLKQVLAEAQQQLEQLKLNQQQLDIDSTKAHTQQDELIATLATLATDVQQVLLKMQNWLKDYNQHNPQSLNLEALQELLILNNDWIQAERIALQAIEEEVTKASSILAERKQDFEKHQQNNASERLFEDLQTLHTVAKTEVEQKKHQKGENNFRLQQNDTNKKQIEHLLKNIAAQANSTENWSKLNEIIGSADGKKFRQIAQEYTLDVLLDYANVHLQALTSRYKIERIPASLGLQVVDQDMGDEVRTVYSLSGGESFLVSLALALGLASLSSSRMKVESLFIDEGFGSLDPTTLNIAMDALERLHNQGRKVGVISHVQEMTERIPVQIIVSKQQSGKSKVEVMGV